MGDPALLARIEAEVAARGVASDLPADEIRRLTDEGRTLEALRLAVRDLDRVTLKAQIKLVGLAEKPLDELLRTDPGQLKSIQINPLVFVHALDRDLVSGLRHLQACEEGRETLMQAAGYPGYDQPTPLERVGWLRRPYFRRQQCVLANWYLALRPACERLEPIPLGLEEFQQAHPFDSGAQLFVPTRGDSARGLRRLLDKLAEAHRERR